MENTETAKIIWGTYTDKNLQGRNATKLIRAVCEQGLSKYTKRLSDSEIEISKPSNEIESELLMDIIEFAVGRHNVIKNS